MLLKVLLFCQRKGGTALTKLVHSWTTHTYRYSNLFMSDCVYCNVPMMGAETLQNAMICCNALPMQYAHTNTHNTNTTKIKHHSKPTCTYTETTNADTHHSYTCHLSHTLHEPVHAYIHTNGLFMFCKVTETAKQHVSISLLPPQRYHTGPHHIICPPPLNVSLHVSNKTSVQIITCMSDGHFQ